MHVNDLIQTFAGERTLSLLRCMAIANGNTSLDSTSVSEPCKKDFSNDSVQALASTSANSKLYGQGVAQSY